jgi:hypothetical protein
MNSKFSFPSKDVLSCEVFDGKLVISIGVDTLAWATVHECENRETGIPVGTKILDATEFARDVQREILRESEDGSSMLTNLLDKAALKAYEQGSLGVYYEGDTDPN